MISTTSASTEADAARTPSLRVVDLVFRYGRHEALSGVSLDVPSGRFVALLGANGAGKTTLFSIVTGLYAAASGQVQVRGMDLRRNTLDALAQMGVVFQRTTLDMDLTVSQNLAYAAALQGMTRQQSRRRIDAAIDRHALGELRQRKVAALSGGQRRRVELARALLHEPSLLLLDEPTVGLDLHSRAEFLDHVRALCVDGETGVLWATHLMQEVESTDRVHVLDRGNVKASGEVAELLRQHGVDDVDALFQTVVSRPSNIDSAELAARSGP